jgi:hypothetical protein
VDSNYRFPDAPVMPRELESRELLDADPANPLGDAFLEVPRRTESSQTHRWRGESTANSSLKLGADSGRVVDDSGIVKRCFALEFRRKLSSLPWQPAPHSGN